MENQSFIQVIIKKLKYEIINVKIILLNWFINYFFVKNYFYNYSIIDELYIIIKYHFYLIFITLYI